MIQNLAQLLLQRAEERPDLMIGAIDEQVTLPELLAHASAFAERIDAPRGGARRPVAIISATSTEFLIAWAGCVLAGTPVALINPDYPGDLLRQMWASLGGAAVITDDPDRFVGVAERIHDIHQVWAERGDVSSRLPGIRATAGDCVSFMHTSGTTGVPKFCEQSHEYFLRLGRVIADALGLTVQDKVWAPLPLFHINPFGYGILGALSAGADALAARRFSARSFWPTVREHGITTMVLHEPPVQILKRATTPEDAHGHSVRSMFYADREFMRSFGVPRAVSAYGSTEAGGVSHVKVWSADDDIPDDAGRHGGAGREDMEWRLEPDGEILVRERASNVLFGGYWSGGAVEPQRDGEGWYHTGDLGRHDDADGLVYLERAAEAIRVKGEFVPIQHVEGVLASALPNGNLAIWKRPSALVDDELVLYIASDEIPIHQLRLASDRLPRFMRPTAVIRVAEIPRDSAAGKVRRRSLPEQKVLQTWEIT